MGASAVGTVGLGTSLAGGILSAFGAEKQGQATQQMYNYQAQVAQINSNIDKQNAEWTVRQGETQTVDYGLKAAQQFGAIRTAQGASGLDVNSGSAVDVQRSQRTITGIDTNQIRTNAAKTAYDYDVKSGMDLNQSTLDIMAGANAKQAGDINAAASILGSVSSVSTKWMQGQQAGMWG